jgi:hypothetical protein
LIFTPTDATEIHMTILHPDTEQAPPQPADEDEPPIDVSRPIGDAIPTPVEPGLDQPLPEKQPDDPEDKDKSKGKAST